VCEVDPKEADIPILLKLFTVSAKAEYFYYSSDLTISFHSCQLGRSTQRTN